MLPFRHPSPVRRLRRLATGFLAACSLAAHAGALPPAVQRALHTAGVPAEAVAVVVQPADSPRPQLAFNAGTAMNPASTMKLVTTLAALETLGPAHLWTTRVLLDGTRDGDTLHGNLVIAGGGDPALTYERFWLLLRDLRDRGLRHITGDLLLDRRVLAVPGEDPDAFDGAGLRPYNVLPDGLLVNFGAVRLRFLPTAQGVRVLSDPPLTTLHVDSNGLELHDGPCGDWESAIEARRVPNGPAQEKLEVSGRFARSCGEKIRHWAGPEPRAYTEGLFRSLWQELGGRFDGAVRDAPTPDTATPFAVQESPPLATTVRDINKWSNNVMARQLMLSLGADGSLPAARRAIADWADLRGLRLTSLVIDNGAGLSRAARLSAGDMAKLLVYAWRSPVMGDFLASLPIAATDGTLKHRFQDHAIAGRGHLKTGYLKGVRTLAGYLTANNGRRQVVVIFINHPRAVHAWPVLEALTNWALTR